MPLDALTNVSDDALLVLFANGDPKAAVVLSHRLGPRIFAHGYRLLGDRSEAEDVAQEAMLRLWKMAPEWRPGEAKITTWFFGSLATCALTVNGATTTGLCRWMRLPIRLTPPTVLKVHSNKRLGQQR